MRSRHALRAAVIASLIPALPTTLHAADFRAKHIILLSIDGLHQADLTDPALSDLIPNIRKLESQGAWYTATTGTTPSDSFPGTLAYLTGAGPATTGVYYDDTFCRSLARAGADVLGTQVQNTEAIDKNSTLLDGGGDCGVASLDVAKLPVDPKQNNRPVWPHAYLRVNTILELAHAAGLRTSIIDKHPAYEIAAGPSGKGVDDLYCPEMDAKAAIVDGVLVDSSSAPPGTSLRGITKNVDLAVAYDQLKFAALIQELHGRNARGTDAAPVPGIVALNLQAVNVAEKNAGGIHVVDGREMPTDALVAALKHIDLDVGVLNQQLHDLALWDSTLLVFVAKHGQDPRSGAAKAVSPTVIRDVLAAAGIELASSTLDDVGILWLRDQAQVAHAEEVLAKLKSSPENPAIEQILFGDSLAAAHLAGPPDRTPDLILRLTPGNVFMDKPTKMAEHGGFCEDDTHVPLILAGGAVPSELRGAIVNQPVTTTQIAVTVLRALGLDPTALQGAQIEHTLALPTD